MKKLNKIFRTDQISEIDKYTEEHEPIAPEKLMERAAGRWTERFLAYGFDCEKIVVLCGKGNNGGDGFVIARLLRQAGRQVVVWVLGEDGKRSPDCKLNSERWNSAGGDTVVIHGPEEVVLDEGMILVDALFGSGLSRPLSGLPARVIGRINASDATVVAVDMPSGLMGEDNGGNDRNAIVKAGYTFTFQFPKLAFLLPENERYVGKWEVLDIGLHEDAIRLQDTGWFYTDRRDAGAMLPIPSVFAHKGQNGRGLLIAGSEGMFGAGILAAQAAVHSGIGLLHVHMPKKACLPLSVTVPEALQEPDASENCFTGTGGLEKYDAVAVGPGIGQAPETVAALKRLLEDWKGRLILDADALNIISVHREMLESLHPGCVLTPHPGEFERLAGKSTNDFERLNKLSNFAIYNRTYVVLKGAYSVVATPQGRLFFNMSGNPGMAKGGSGDVLTGVLLALAAGGMDMEDCVRTAVFAHGLSGDLLRGEYGFRGISSSMIAGNMGKVWKILENEK